MSNVVGGLFAGKNGVMLMTRRAVADVTLKAAVVSIDTARRPRAPKDFTQLQKCAIKVIS